MEHLSPEEQLKRAGKTTESFAKEVMDYLIKLYSHQMGVQYEYHEVSTDDNTA